MNPSPSPTNATTGPLVLRAGDLTMTLHRTGGELRHVRWGEVEVLRGIYGAVRDAHWGTVLPEISDWSIDTHDDHFRVTFQAVCKEGSIDFRWRGTITGTPDGTITYEFDGQAHTTFDRNRIGLCVLHPIRPCVGKPCRIHAVDGQTTDGVFPTEISPHQPFRNIRSIAHEVEPGVWETVTMEGETFEMEDQRNWSDASFKTYGTPLDLPFPVRVEQGTQVRQQVRLSLDPVGQAPRPRRTAESCDQEVVPLRLSVPVQLPKLGLQVGHHGLPLDEQQVERLRALRLHHLRVDLRFDDEFWRHRLTQAAREANSLRASLHVAAHFPHARIDDELQAFCEALFLQEAFVAAVLLYQQGADATPSKLIKHARRSSLMISFPPFRLAVGTDSHFAELNRNRPAARGDDLVTFSITPQVHALDDRSIVETLEVQAEMVSCARKFAGGREILVGPITLKDRHLQEMKGVSDDAPPPTVDPRQATPFTAAWTLGSIAELARGGAAFATYFETTGCRGVMELSSSQLTEIRPLTSPGDVYPVYRVLADLAADSYGEVRAIDSPPPHPVRGLLLECDGHSKLMLANLTGQAWTVRLPDEPWDRLSACRNITLNPWAYACIECRHT